MEFALNRFETVMDNVQINWKQLNAAFNYDLEKMCKDQKPPMKNMIDKACRYMGLETSDYVYMKTNNLTFNKDLFMEGVVFETKEKGKGSRYKLTEEKIAYAIQEIKNGRTQLEIAKELGVAQPSLSSAIKKYTGSSLCYTHTRNNPPSKEELSTAYDLWKDGSTFAAIAELLNVSETTARKYMLKYESKLAEEAVLEEVVEEVTEDVAADETIEEVVEEMNEENTEETTTEIVEEINETTEDVEANQEPTNWAVETAKAITNNINAFKIVECGQRVRKADSDIIIYENKKSYYITMSQLRSIKDNWDIANGTKKFHITNEEMVMSLVECGVVTIHGNFHNKKPIIFRKLNFCDYHLRMEIIKSRLYKLIEKETIEETVEETATVEEVVEVANETFEETVEETATVEEVVDEEVIVEEVVEVADETIEETVEEVVDETIKEFVEEATEIVEEVVEVDEKALAIADTIEEVFVEKISEDETIKENASTIIIEETKEIKTITTEELVTKLDSLDNDELEDIIAYANALLHLRKARARLLK